MLLYPRLILFFFSHTNRISKAFFGFYKIVEEDECQRFELPCNCGVGEDLRFLESKEIKAASPKKEVNPERSLH